MIFLKVVLLLGSLCYFLASLFIRFGLKRTNIKKHSDKQPAVTVIIPARNEQDNISACLESVLEQDYSNYNVVLVNDNSSDDTVVIAEKFLDLYKNFSVLNLPSNVTTSSPKKAAISFGIKNSTTDIIVTTDADCVLKSTWLSSIAWQYDNLTNVVVSWLLVEKSNKLLSKVEFLDSIFYSIIGAAMLGWGRPILANGANFSYRKSTFDSVGGFSGQEQYVSGDDDLLLQKFAKQKSGKIKFNPALETVVFTKPASSISQLLSQRLRWASKGPIYPVPFLLLQMGFYLFYLTLFSCFLFLLEKLWPIVFVGFALKALSDFIILFAGKQKLEYEIEILPFFLFQIFQFGYVIIIGAGGLFGQFTWKGRKFVRGKTEYGKRRQETGNLPGD